MKTHLIICEVMKILLTRSDKLIILCLVTVGFLLLQTKAAFSQEASSSGKVQISYPISTLGNCESLTACKEYCDDETHKEACIAFAKSRGFYKDPQGTGNARSRLVIEKAKTELGCSSEVDCKAFCGLEENKQKCEEFAKKYNLKASQGINDELLEKAKRALGCDSEQGCKSLCQLEVNKEKCSLFAQENKLGGGVVKIATASAKNKQTFEQTQKTIQECMDDLQKCSKDFEKIEKEISKNSEEFCKSNTGKCGKPENKLKTGSRSADLIKEKVQKDVKFGDKQNFGSEVQGVSTGPSFFEQIVSWWHLINS